MNKYTFIHPTKSGGTSINRYFQEYYIEYINISNCHKEICTDDNNPIIVVRDVKERFLSQYKYWKNGSELYSRNQDWKNDKKDATIYDYIEMIKNKDEKLIHEFTWRDHFLPTKHWFGETKYKNIIIIRYSRDMNEKIRGLLNYLDIPYNEIPIKKVNITMKTYESIDMNDKKINDFLNDYYSEDIKLIEDINKNPELFRKII